MKTDIIDKIKTIIAQKKVFIGLRWFFGCTFAIIAFVNGLHFSSIFLVLAAVLMLPLSFTKTCLEKVNLKSSFAVVISLVILCVGIFTSPIANADDKKDIPDDLASLIEEQKAAEETKDTDKSNDNNNKEDNEDQKNTQNQDTKPEDEEKSDPNPEDNQSGDAPVQNPENLEQGNADSSEKEPEEKVQMVWVSATGSKYHSKSNCSGMKNPTEITLDEAEKAGYEPCKRCH